MPAKAKKERYSDVRFVNYELSKEQATACKAKAVSHEDLWETAHELCTDGYSISLRWDDYSKSYAAFVSTKDEKSPNFGLMLTGRGSSPFKALKQAMFKNFDLMDGDWTDFAERGGPDEIDD